MKDHTEEWIQSCVVEYTDQTKSLVMYYGRDMFTDVISFYTQLLNSNMWHKWSLRTIQPPLKTWIGRFEQIKLEDYRKLQQQNYDMSQENKILVAKLEKLKKQIAKLQKEKNQYNNHNKKNTVDDDDDDSDI